MPMIICRKRKVDRSQLSWGVLREMDITARQAGPWMDGTPDYYFRQKRITSVGGFWTTPLLPGQKFELLDKICEAITNTLDYQEGVAKEMDDFLSTIDLSTI